MTSLVRGREGWPKKGQTRGGCVISTVIKMTGKEEFKISGGLCLMTSNKVATSPPKDALSRLRDAVDL